MDIKKEHHFVWAYYLRKWSNNKRDIYWITPKGKVESHSVRDLAKERHLYRSQTLSREQIEVIRYQLGRAHRIAQKVGTEMLEQYLEIQSKEELAAALNLDLPGEAWTALNFVKSRFIEDRHALHETFAKPILKRLSEGDHSALTDKDISSFLIFLGHQVTRTRLFREQWHGAAERDGSWGEAWQGCWWFLGYVAGVNFGATLYEQRNNLNFCLLESADDVNFVTSDNPAIQFDENFGGVSTEDNPTLGTLIFPVSPKFAFLASDAKGFKQGKVSANLEFVVRVNEKIAERAEKTVFGLEAADVEPFRRKWST